jgi:protein SCO1/2
MRSRCLLLVTFVAALQLGAANHASDEPELPIHDGVGGEFSAPSSLGRDVSLSEYRGKPVLLFFGYTSCQDVCPVTLAHLKSLMKQLGPASENVQVLLVTVDPETDTADHLREYLARFDPRFVGITGEPEQTARIEKLFMAKHDRSHGMKLSTQYNRSKPLADHAYLYSHSQQIYLLDKAGRTRALFFSGSPLDEMGKAVLALLNEGSDRGDRHTHNGDEAREGEGTDEP